MQHRVATLLVQHDRRHQNHPTGNLFLKSCRFRLCSTGCCCQLVCFEFGVLHFRLPLYTRNGQIGEHVLLWFNSTPERKYPTWSHVPWTAGQVIFVSSLYVRVLQSARFGYRQTERKHNKFKTNKLTTAASQDQSQKPQQARLCDLLKADHPHPSGQHDRSYLLPPCSVRARDILLIGLVFSHPPSNICPQGLRFHLPDR